MNERREYVLGQSEFAARRLAIQDAHFGDFNIRPADRVVEFGCGPGGFSRRILKRLGVGGVLVGVDASEGLLKQATDAVADVNARFEPVHADITTLGDWLDGADVVVGRAVLHHVPMAEFFLGRLRARLKLDTRIGFIEPDFRSPLARLSYLEATGRVELAPLRLWAVAINQLYLANRISPDVGASLSRTLHLGGYQKVCANWSECRSDEMMIENMLMFYDEVKERLESLGIMTAVQVEEQQRLLRALEPSSLPAAWGIHSVVGQAF
jgi:SAM-dependent methyltransferase